MLRALTAGRDLRRNAARDPGKVVPGIEPRGDLVLSGQRIFGIGVHQRGEGVRGGLLVGNLRGIGVDGVGTSTVMASSRRLRS